MQLSKVEQAYADVHKFNAISNNLTNVGEASIDHQLSMIFSEFEETVEAFENRDAPEVAKEAVDLLVTVYGLIQKLSAAGFNMDKAIEVVNANNLSKFVPKGEALQYDDKFTASFNQEHAVWIVKDNEGKIRKHTNYKKADVSDCVPKDGFFKGVP